MIILAGLAIAVAGFAYMVGVFAPMGVAATEWWQFTLGWLAFFAGGHLVDFGVRYEVRGVLKARERRN